MLSIDLRQRRSNIPRNVLFFPEKIVSKEQLLIIAGYWKMRKNMFNLYKFVRTLHFLNADGMEALHILNLRCERRSRNDWRCSDHHFTENELNYRVVLWKRLYSSFVFYLLLRKLERNVFSIVLGEIILSRKSRQY